MSELMVRIDGMSCGHCVSRVTKALERTPGVTVKQVEVGTATVDYDGREESRDAIAAAIDRVGFTVRPETAANHESQ